MIFCILLPPTALWIESDLTQQQIHVHFPADVPLRWKMPSRLTPRSFAL